MALLMAAAVVAGAAMARGDRLGAASLNGWEEAAVFAAGGTLLHALLGFW